MDENKILFREVENRAEKETWVKEMSINVLKTRSVINSVRQPVHGPTNWTGWIGIFQINKIQKIQKNLKTSKK